MVNTSNENIVASVEPFADERERENACANLGAVLKSRDWHAFYVEGVRMGWRKTNGKATLVAEDGEGFIRQVNGVNGPNHWTVWDQGDWLYMRIWHHDANHGEGRYIYPAKQCVFCGEVLTPDETYHHDGDPVCLYHYEIYELEIA